MGYKVKLDIFEGPFDLLVYLIERAEMNIYDIQVAEITRQYMEYVDRMRKTDPALAGDFMVLAASLIEIKSKMLLPGKKAEEDGLIMEDPRSELVQKLLEYKKFKGASDFLEQKEEEARRIFTKPQEDLTVYTKEPDEILSLDLKQFMNAFALFLQKKKKLEDIRNQYTRVRRRQMTLETRIEQIKSLFHTKKKFRFEELVGQEQSRYNIALTFLTVLEMMRQKTVKVRQTVNFGEIIVTVNQKDE